MEDGPSKHGEKSWKKTQWLCLFCLLFNENVFSYIKVSDIVNAPVNDRLDRQQKSHKIIMELELIIAR